MLRLNYVPSLNYVLKLQSIETLTQQSSGRDYHSKDKELKKIYNVINTVIEIHQKLSIKSSLFDLFKCPLFVWFNGNKNNTYLLGLLIKANDGAWFRAIT